MTPEDELQTVVEVAARFRVNPRTITNWVRKHKLAATRTPGGHYRFRKVDIDRILGAGAETTPQEG